MPYLKDTDAAYLAGILDSDGHIGLVRRNATKTRSGHLRPIVQIGQSKRIMLDHIQKITGTGCLGINKHRHFYNLRFYTIALRWILPQVLPYLVVKKRQAEILIRFMERLKWQGKELTVEEISKREALWAELRVLNLKPRTARMLAENETNDSSNVVNLRRE